jgi:hypothetical protein
MYQYKSGIGAVGSYQVSGNPWITGSGQNGLVDGAEHQISFPTVARSVTVMAFDPAEDDEIRVHFNSTGSGDVIAGNHFFPLSVNRDAITFQTKCKEIFISNASGNDSGYIVLADLTDIGVENMLPLTGSGLTD